MFKRFLNAISGAAHEAGDAVMDIGVVADAEIRGTTEEMKNALEKAKQNEAKLGGNVKGAKRELAEVETQLQQYEAAAMKAAENGDDAQAEEFAIEAESFAQQVEDKKAILAEFENALVNQKKAIVQIRQNLKLVESETKALESKRAVNQAKKAATASMQTVSGEDTNNALAVLRRRKEQAAKEADRLDYVEEQIDDANKPKDAAAYLKESGAGGSALDRLKAKQNKG